MRFDVYHLLASLVLPTLALALPSQPIESRENVAPHLKGKRSFYEHEGVKRTVFEHEATGAKIDFVTNSGICETTAGVNQYSGYLSVGSKSSICEIDQLLTGFRQ
jgi:carboxypeptidase D